MTQENKTLSERDVWNSLNEIIKGLVKESESPYLCLLLDDIEEPLRSYMLDKLMNQQLRTNQLLDRLQDFPALYAAIISKKLFDSYGQDSKASVYPYIEELLADDQDLTQSQKEKLWRLFRKACRNLGLGVLPSTSGHNYMVREYLRQAGVPKYTQRHLLEVMVKTMNQVGLPEIENQQEISDWQNAVLNSPSLHRVSTVALSNLKEDFIHYHVNSFVNAVNSLDEKEVQVSGFELAARNYFKRKSTQGSFKPNRLAIPILKYLNGTFSVHFPSHTDFEKSAIIIDSDQRFLFSPSPETADFHIDNLLLNHLVVESPVGKEVIRKSVWGEDKNNRLLIFDHDGNLIDLAILAKEDSKNYKPVNLKPGTYKLLSRFYPGEEHRFQEFSYDEEILYELEIELRPGKSISLYKSDFLTTLAGEAMPQLSFSGNQFLSSNNIQFYNEHELFYLADIPEDDHSYDLEILVNKGIVKSVQDISGGLNKNCLEEVTQELKAGLHEISIRVRKSQMKRFLASSKVLLWKGLSEIHTQKSITYFDCDEKPINFDFENNKNLEWADSSLVLKDQSARRFNLGFQLPHKYVLLEWLSPGIFVYLTLTNQNSNNTEKFLPLGNTAYLPAKQRGFVKVYSDKAGTFSIGKTVYRYSPKKNSYLSIPIGPILQNLDNSKTLQFTPLEDPKSKADLVNFSSEHLVHGLRRTEADLYEEIEFTCTNRVQKVRLNGINLVSRSEKIGIELEPFGEDPKGFLRFFETKLEDIKLIREQGLNCYKIDLTREKLPSGLWHFEVELLIDGIYGVASDSNGKMNFNLVNLSKSDWVALEGTEFEVDDLKLILKTNKLYESTSFAGKCGNLNKLWNLLTHQYSSERPKKLKGLLNLLVHANDEFEDVVAMDKLSPESSLFWIFQQEREQYKNLKFNNNLLSQSLRLLPNLDNRIQSLIDQEKVAPYISAGFSNAHELAKDQFTIGKAFCPVNYLAALGYFPASLSYAGELAHWLPSGDEMMGRNHLDYALAALQRRFEVLTSVERHDLIYDRQALGQFSQEITQGKRNLNAWSETALTNILNQRNGQRISHEIGLLIKSLFCISYYARQELYKAGNSTDFINRIKPNTSALNYQRYLGNTIRMGEELFGFFLVLWELAIKSGNLIYIEGVNYGQ